MENKKIYLDNSATTALHPDILKEMEPYFSKIYGNPSSFHQFGKESKEALNQARSKIASLINASPEEIIFTSCGTESDNLAIFGVLNANSKKGHIITCKIEHHAVLYTCKHLESLGYYITYIDVDENGFVSVEDIKNSIKEDTVLISIMHANNEVGTIEPIEEISKLLKEINKNRQNKIYFHTDAVQSAGKIPLDVEKLGIDLLSMTAHKFHGPKGVGVLYIKKGTAVKPIMFGGHHENGLRPGTENVPYAVGMAKALEIAVLEMEAHTKHILKLKEKLKEGLLNKIPEIIINGSTAKAVPNILNVSFKYIEGESLLAMMDMHGIAASTGSACATGEEAVSHVLAAMNLEPLAAQGTIRFSFSYQNTEEEIDYVLEVLPKIVENLRAMSPVYKGK